MINITDCTKSAIIFHGLNWIKNQVIHIPRVVVYRLFVVDAI